MPGNTYDDVRYVTLPAEQSHPNRLASVAALFGMSPKPVTACRVLDIGCGAGGNLIPMAYYLPGSEFIGIDLAESPVADGNRAIERLGLKNIRLRAMDLCDIGPDWGQFDYIIAVGVYSWVPAPVREALLALCNRLLSPQGVAFITYNTLPGRYARQMFRDMMMYHTRSATSARERIDRSRELLQKVAAAQLMPTSWQGVTADQLEHACNSHEGFFYHDDLAPINEYFYFRDFAAAAARHSLQYLGEGQAHFMFDVRNPLDWVRGGVLDREQYFDYLSLRQYRQTLLCRQEIPLKRPPTPEPMDQFLFCSPATREDGAIQGFHMVSITDPPESISRVAEVLEDAFPSPVPFDNFLAAVPDRNALRDILFSLITSGFADFHLHDPAAGNQPNPRPRATPLAQWECETTGVVTSAIHETRKMDPSMRTFISLLDGTRDLDEIAAQLSHAEGAPPAGEIRARLYPVLMQMARTGLLAP